MRIQAVTALYDLGRSAVDGRSIDRYIDWLNATLKAPLPFTIFLDPGIDAERIARKPGDEIVAIPREEFPPFRWRNHVRRLCTTRYAHKGGVEYRIVDYGLLIHSKFAMLQRTRARHPDCIHLLWIDAGASRFFPNGFRPIARTEVAAPMVIGISPRLERALLLRLLSGRHVGRSTRLATATDFLVRADYCDTLARTVEEFVETEWLPNDLWDNEQVSLGYLIYRKRLSVLPLASKKYGVVTAWLMA